MKDNLIIALKYKKTISYIFKITDNYPHRYKELKSRIINVTLDILEDIYISNEDYNRKKYIIPKIKMLDYYLRLSYEFKIITEKKYITISSFLLETIKMISGWKSEENK